MDDKRYKEIMVQLGMPNSISLFLALQQVGNEVTQEAEKKVNQQASVSNLENTSITSNGPSIPAYSKNHLRNFRKKVAKPAPTINLEELTFDGSDYDYEVDQARLTGQCLRIFNLMKDGVWRTLDGIHKKTQDPHASISAQLRHLRKRKFGSHDVLKRSRGERNNGLFEYCLIPNLEQGILVEAV